MSICLLHGLNITNRIASRFDSVGWVIRIVGESHPVTIYHSLTGSLYSGIILKSCNMIYLGGVYRGRTDPSIRAPCRHLHKYYTSSSTSSKQDCSASASLHRRTLLPASSHSTSSIPSSQKRSPSSLRRQLISISRELTSSHTTSAEPERSRKTLSEGVPWTSSTLESLRFDILQD